MNKKYESYKASKIKWAGKIPSNWELSKIKYVTNNEDGKREPISGEFRFDKRGDFPYYGATGIVDYINDFRFDGKYLLIGEDGAPFFIPNKNVAFIAEGKFWVNNHAHVLSNKEEFDLDYLCYLLNCVDYREYISGSTRDKLTKADLSDIRILLPSLNEQTKIAQYLDHQTAIIDQLILQKEKMIELLREKKQAVINEAVTKGLNPNVKTKDSGIEWLGEVPEGWQVIKLKFLIDQLESGVSVNSENVPIEIDSSERGVLKTSCVFNYSFIPEENKKVVQEEFDRVQCPVRGNSIIISRMNTPELVGASGYVDRDYPNLYLPDRLWQTVFNDNIELDVEFLSFVLKSEAYRNIYGIIATGTSPSMKNISQNSFLDLPVALPDVKTQNDIKIYLREFDIKTSISLNALVDSIGKLKEYRQSIISEAVTGKIDVRDWQPNKKQRS